MGALAALVAPERALMALGLLAAAVVAVSLALIPAAIVRPLFAAAMAPDKLAGLPGLLALAGMLLGLAAVAQFAQDALFGLAAARAGARLRQGVFAAWLRARPLGLAGDGSGGRTARLALDVRELELFLANDVAATFNQVLTVVVATALLVSFSPRLTLGLVVAILPLSLLLALLTRRVEAAVRDQQGAASAASDAMSEALTRLETVKAFSMQQALLARFAAPNGRQRRASAQRSLLAASQQPLAQLALGAAVIVLLAIAGGELRSGRLDAAGLTAYLTQLGIAAAPLQMLARGLGKWGAMREPARAVVAALQVKPEEDAGRIEAPARRGAIELRDVRAVYPGSGNPALEGVTFAVRPGEVVAIVGPSGAGKTTLARLLLRLLDPAAGRVLLDGVELSEYTLAAARASLALVPQQPGLLRGSVLDNLRLARPQLAEAEALAALEAAGLRAELEPLGGLARQLGEGGEGLSGGQAQRLAIARALVTDAPILLLDEPTAALDAFSEAAIRRTVASLRGKRTVLVIAHRLSTVEAADRVIVLSGGLVVEEGPPALLAAGGGAYSRLLEASRP